MATVSGSLVFVSSRAAQVSEVWVRAPRVRTHDSGVVTTGNDRFPVTSGEVSFTAVPGPAVLALISQGRAVDTIPIVVGEGESQSLQDVVRAAQVVDESTQREIERLSAEMMDTLRAARTEAEAASGSAARAGVSAGEAAASASEAAESAGGAAMSESAAARSAEQAGGHASAASSSASGAATSEQNAAKSADDANASATRAADSATSAKNDADKVANTLDNTFWQGDRLAVNGMISPHLTGPKGDPGADGTMTFEELTDEQRESLRGEQGPPGKDGASTWDAIQGKPAAFPPAGHRHTMADISDLPAVATQKYVDAEVGKCATKSDLESRIRLVDSAPSSPTTGVLYLIAE
ncbi:hypothetical protein ACL1HT_04280 [Corynebacterium striatum]|nr:hypothetical protein [Corynebacterium striatum]HAT6493880.1 hypothetical protein [Corynebacterium striatum]HAT6496192.1 hypothetical protein [Corynebacterium striatum]HAT6620110.1 hypothetical protein [Corynebacterium striatum]HCG3138915.1 hypothetical protein [Corynebacterium striatum]